MDHSTLTHAEIQEKTQSLIAEGMRMGSQKEALMAHAEDYGVENIEVLFPDALDVNNQPVFVNNNTGWVSNVMSNVFKQPFARIRSSYSDITGEEVRAKGYAKSRKKTEEVLTVIRRTTMPTTIYKKQKLDRDDIIDITDFNVIGWIKSNMRLKLDEEIARCILIGDGRLSSSEDYIDRECIRPIHTDDDVYSIKVSVANDADKYRNFIREVIKARKKYKGSGDPTLYIGEDILAELLLLEDKNGRVLYESAQSLAKTLRVKEIVSACVLDGVQRTDSKDVKQDLMGIIVNLRDYSVGANSGGKVALFEDFDIDYNQEKYLIETRLSGALTTPFSAMVIETPTEVPAVPPEEVPSSDPEEII